MIYYDRDTIEEKLNNLNDSEITDKPALVGLIKDIKSYKNHMSFFMEGFFIDYHGVGYSGVHARERLILEKYFPTITQNGYHWKAMYDKDFYRYDDSLPPELSSLLDTVWDKKTMDKIVETSSDRVLKWMFRHLYNEDYIFDLIAFLKLDNLDKVAPLLIDQIEKIISLNKYHCDRMRKNDPENPDISSYEYCTSVLAILETGLKDVFPECREEQELN